MRKIIKTTTISLAIALAVSPVLASYAEAHAKCTSTVTHRGRTTCTSSDPNHVTHSHPKEESNHDILWIIGGGLVLLVGGLVIYNLSTEINKLKESTQLKPTVNYDSETDSVSYGFRYTIPLE